MPKVPKIKVFFLFNISRIDQTEGCSETLAQFRSLHTLAHFKIYRATGFSVTADLD